ncbi:MAG TPA: hypothetical protein VLG72_05350 [Nitrospirota bacterium]|nr:hypothetical protein [Nitrospirota bacterium]
MIRIIKAILALAGLDDTLDADLPVRYPVVNRLMKYPPLNCLGNCSGGFTAH